MDELVRGGPVRPGGALSRPAQLAKWHPETGAMPATATLARAEGAWLGWTAMGGLGTRYKGAAAARRGAHSRRAARSIDGGAAARAGARAARADQPRLRRGRRVRRRRARAFVLSR
eukprot:scaffold2869_cov245-Prasinococcus_capsulatus_cf.AAC.4